MSIDPKRLAVAEHLLTCWDYHEGRRCSHEWIGGQGTPVGPVNLAQAEALAAMYSAVPDWMVARIVANPTERVRVTHE
jgi:hypothetical protein